MNLVARMGEVLPPRESGKLIADTSHDVSISDEGVKKTAKLIFDCLKSSKPVIHTDRWKTHELNPKTEDKSAVDWIFLSDVGNFSFWSDDEKNKYVVKYGGKEWTGYWSWCAAINRALDEGIPFTDPVYLAALTREQLVHILRSDSDTPMPLIDERLQVLKEAGKVLTEKYEGSFVNVIAQCGNSAQKLLQLLVQDFPSFRDTAPYSGRTVSLYKRVQILIADVWACCGGKGYGEFTDIDTITMFADYRIPQALVWFGALTYSENLTELLNKKTMFQSGERLEVEIRGNTIWAVELIVEEVKRMIAAEPSVPQDTVINAIHVDHYLWDYRREHAAKTEHIPIHRIRCIYY